MVKISCSACQGSSQVSQLSPSHPLVSFSICICCSMQSDLFLSCILSLDPHYSQSADCSSWRFSWLTSALYQHGSNTFKWVRETSFPLFSSLEYISFDQSWDNSVGIATDYRLGGRGIRIQLPAGARDFSFCTLFRPAVGSTHLNTRDYFLGHQADHKSPFSVEVKNTWINTSTIPHVFMVWWLIEHRITSLLVISSDVT